MLANVSARCSNLEKMDRKSKEITSESECSTNVVSDTTAGSSSDYGPIWTFRQVFKTTVKKEAGTMKRCVVLLPYCSKMQTQEEPGDYNEDKGMDIKITKSKECTQSDTTQTMTTVENDTETNRGSTLQRVTSDGQATSAVAVVKKDTTLKAPKTKYQKKKYFCIYCKELRTNFYRHLEIVHSEEGRVKEFINFDKGSSERRYLIDSIRDDGSFEYNKNHLDKPILARRRFVHPVPECPEKYFLPCPECRKQLSHKNLYKHYKTCRGRPDKLLHARSVLRNSKALMTRINPLANEILLKKIIPPMHHDTIFQILRKDKLIILFGNHLTPKYTGHQEYIIRNQMRTMARYLKIVKELCPEIDELSKLFTPRYFEICFQAVNKLAGLQLSGTYRSPKTALQMIQFLKICSRILKNYYIMTEKNKKKKKKVLDFQSLFEVEAAGRISKPAHKNLVDNNRKKITQNLKKLPVSKDVDQFKKYLSKTAETKYQELKKHGFKLELWKELAEVVLLFLVVFNKKRSRESNRILTTDFENLQQLSDTALPEIYENLTELEKGEAESFYKIIIRGKLGRMVWIFVPKDIKTYLDYIYEHRVSAFIPEGNPYLFGLPGVMSGGRFKTLETCNLMRRYTILANLQNPDSMRTTLLRKHFATKVSTLNLADAQQETVQDFMGHQEKIHKGFYRQQIVSKDLLMTKILTSTANKNLTSTSNTSDVCLEAAENVIDDVINLHKEEMHQYRTLRRNLFKNSEDVQQENIHLPTLRTQDINRHSRAAKKCPSKKKTADSDFESSVDSENANIYKHNLNILKSTPKKCFKKMKVQPREMRNDRKCKIKKSLAQSHREVDNEEDSMDYSSGADKSVKPEDLEEDTDESYSEESNTRTFESPIMQARPRLMSPQKRTMLKVFADHLKNGTYPSGSECLAAIKRYPELRDRTSAKIKSFLQNYRKKMEY